jgi:hypothetical protein
MFTSNRWFGALTAVAGLALTLGLGTPAEAQVSYSGNQMIVQGTVTAVANDVCSMQTPNGIVSVPLNSTTFYVDGNPVSYLNLTLGEPVEAISQPAYSYEAPPPDVYLDGAWDWGYPYYYGGGYIGPGYWGHGGYYGHQGAWGGGGHVMGPGFNGSRGAGNFGGGHFGGGTASPGHFGGGGGHFGGGGHGGGGGHSGGGRR